MFHTAILKLTARCNLDCTYCYVFNQADETYRRIPKAMPVATALTCLERVRSHVTSDAHDGHFAVTLHGGEPTIWPLSSFSAFFDRVEDIRADGVDLSVGLQTNGLRLGRPLLELLAEHRATIGISLDGPKEHNDRYRVTHTGRGSYDRIMRTIESIIDAGYERLIGGFLAVAQPTISPAAFLDWADSLPVRSIDVLWPIEFNYDNPPWRATSVEEYFQQPPYGRWFADLFTEWWRRNDPTLCVRLFYQTVQVILGSKVHTDSIVNDVLDMFVVNTDGGIEYPDYFRAYADGGTRTDYNVARDDLDALGEDPVFDFCLNLGDHRPHECDPCPCARECGGGFLAGRMRRGATIPTERSVLCPDHFYFFMTVRAIMAQHRDQIAESLREVARL
jgi:uncharacterized protein